MVHVTRKVAGEDQERLAPAVVREEGAVLVFFSLTNSSTIILKTSFDENRRAREVVAPSYFDPNSTTITIHGMDELHCALV